MTYTIFMGVYYLIVFCFISVLLKVSYKLSKDKEFLGEFSKISKSKSEKTAEDVNSLARMIAIIACVLTIAIERVIHFLIF